MRFKEALMRFVVYQGSDLPRVAERLLSQRVYEESGELQHDWKRIMLTGKTRQRKCLIVTAEHLDKDPESPNNPMWRIYGVLLYEIKRSHMQVYVRPEFRRRGIAGRLLQRLRDFENYDSRVISADEGYPGCVEWFERNLIYVPDYQFTEAEILQVNGELYRAGRLVNPMPYHGDAVREIIKRRKRAFLQKVLKAKKEGRI